jgi:hypothetical protein
MVATMTNETTADEAFRHLRRERLAALAARIGFDLADADARPDPLLVGSLVWQRRERQRARDEGRSYSIEGAIRHEYETLHLRDARVRRLNSDGESETGKQLAPDFTSLLDLKDGIGHLPDNRGAGYQRTAWRLCVVGGLPAGLGSAPHVYTYFPVYEPEQGAAALGVARRDVTAALDAALAWLVVFLCDEGVLQDD